MFENYFKVDTAASQVLVEVGKYKVDVIFTFKWGEGNSAGLMMSSNRMKKAFGGKTAKKFMHDFPSSM